MDVIRPEWRAPPNVRALVTTRAFGDMAGADAKARLRALVPSEPAWLKQVHIKDGARTKVPGTWGEEVPVGRGDVPWAEFFATLRELNFDGYCCIEREAGNSRIEDIGTAKKVIEKLGA